MWTLDGGLTRITDSNLNRFFTDFPVDEHHYLSDAAWRWTAGARFNPPIPESVPLHFAYQLTKQNYENLTAFDYTANDLSAEAVLPAVAGLRPRLGGGMDWSSDSQGLTGNARWVSAGLDHFGRWISALRVDADYLWTEFSESDRNAEQVNVRALAVRTIRRSASVFGQYSWIRNDAINSEFSYIEQGAEGGLLFRRPDWVEWGARYEAHFRDYAAFDPRFGLRRHDFVQDVYLTSKLVLAPNLMSAFASLQYELGRSNSELKIYDDQVFSVGLQVSY